jgi:hypothetical protein
VRIPRPATDELIRTVVIERLRRPDAEQLLAPPGQHVNHAREIEGLRRRRGDLVDMVADGVLPATVARPRLEMLASEIAALQSLASGIPINRGDLVDPLAAWERWTLPQQRDGIRLLFSDIRLQHASPQNGPRADIRRIRVVWSH